MYGSGYQVAIIENHNGDDYATTASNARINYYGITAIPTTVFNGGTQVVGSTVSEFETAYTNALAVMSDFTMELSYVQNGSNLDVTVDMEKVNAYAGTNLVLQLTLIESHIPEEWGGLSEVNFVNRAMYPNENGTSLDFSSNSSITETFAITPDAAWDLDNSDIVAFIQDSDSKEILQADKITLATAVGTNNAKLSEIINPDGISCENVTTPLIKIKNKGSATLTSLTINYDINGSLSGSVDWTGSLEFNTATMVELEELTYDQLETNNITITLSNPNGTTDDDPSDNELSKEFYKATYGIGPLYMELHTDNWGDECTWEIQNSLGEIVESGGPYGNNQTIEETFTLEEDCYTFFVYDSYGDGGGEIIIEDAEGTQLFYTDGSYGDGTNGEFGYISSSTAPIATFSPADGTNDVAIDTEITVSFNQAVRNLDNSEITDPSEFITLKINNSGGDDVGFSSSINEAKTVFTVVPDIDLLYNQIYYIEISDQFEGSNDMQFEGASASFTTIDDDGIRSVDNSCISLYPNPAKDQINIDFGEKLQGISNISIFNLTGAVVYNNSKITGTSKTIDISNLEPGVYLIKIMNKDICITSKFNIIK